MALVAAERETIITTSDADDFWHIQTSQRAMVTKLLKSSMATILLDKNFDGTRMITATVPKNGITVRGGTTGKRVVKRGTMPDSAAKCKGIKTDGAKCGALAKGDTGFCMRHQVQAKQ